MRVPRLKRGDPVEILWDDHCGQSGWAEDHGTDMRLMLIRSVGLFLRRTGKTITIAQSDDDATPHSKTNDRLTLALSTVRKVKRLR